MKKEKTEKAEKAEKAENTENTENTPKKPKPQDPPSPIDWANYGFIELEHLKGAYVRRDFPLEIRVVGDFLRVGIGPSQILSDGKVVANNKSIELLLEAFDCEKTPE